MHTQHTHSSQKKRIFSCRFKNPALAEKEKKNTHCGVKRRIVNRLSCVCVALLDIFHKKKKEKVKLWWRRRRRLCIWGPELASS